MTHTERAEDYLSQVRDVVPQRAWKHQLTTNNLCIHLFIGCAATAPRRKVNSKFKTAIGPLDKFGKLLTVKLKNSNSKVTFSSVSELQHVNLKTPSNVALLRHESEVNVTLEASFIILINRQTYIQTNGHTDRLQ